MSCDPIRERLSEHLDGEVPPGDLAAIERHLASCEACRRELAGLRRVSAELGRLAHRKAPAHLAASIRDRIARERLFAAEPPGRKRPLRLYPWLKGMGLAVAAVLVLMVGNPLRQRDEAVDAPSEQELEETRGRSPILSPSPAGRKGGETLAAGKESKYSPKTQERGLEALKGSADGGESDVRNLPGSEHPETVKSDEPPPAAEELRRSADPSSREPLREKAADAQKQTLADGSDDGSRKTEDIAKGFAESKRIEKEAQSAARERSGSANGDLEADGGRTQGVDRLERDARDLASSLPDPSDAKKRKSHASPSAVYRFRPAADKANADKGKDVRLGEIARHPALRSLRADPAPKEPQGALQKMEAGIASSSQGQAKAQESAPRGGTPEEAGAPPTVDAPGRLRSMQTDERAEGDRTVVLEGEVTEEELSAILAALRDAGFEPVEAPERSAGKAAGLEEGGLGKASPKPAGGGAASRRRIRIVLEAPPGE